MQKAEYRSGRDEALSAGPCRSDIHLFRPEDRASSLCILHSIILHDSKQIALRPPQQCGGGQLRDVDCGRPLLLPYPDKGAGQVIAHRDDSALLVRPLQEFPGLLGPAGVIQVKDAQNLPMGHCHRLAQVQIHKRLSLSFFDPGQEPCPSTSQKDCPRGPKEQDHIPTPSKQEPIWPGSCIIDHSRDRNRLHQGSTQKP